MISQNWTIDALLCLGVVAAWAASFGLLFKRGGLDSLHYPSFIAATTGTAITLAGLFAEGLTTRVGKLVLLDAMAMVSGLVMSHALARGAMRRQARVTRRVSLPARRPD